jgi:hypothetical protein
LSLARGSVYSVGPSHAQLYSFRCLFAALSYPSFICRAMIAQVTT